MSLVPSKDDDDTDVHTEIGERETAIQAMCRGIAALKGISMYELDWLYDRIEMEALNELVRHSNKHNKDVNVVFTIEEYTVVVTSKNIHIYEGDPVIVHREHPQ